MCSGLDCPVRPNNTAVLPLDCNRAGVTRNRLEGLDRPLRRARPFTRSRLVKQDPIRQLFDIDVIQPERHSAAVRLDICLLSGPESRKSPRVLCGIECLECGQLEGTKDQVRNSVAGRVEWKNFYIHSQLAIRSNGDDERLGGMGHIEVQL